MMVLWKFFLFLTAASTKRPGNELQVCNPVLVSCFKQ